jgi:3-oxoacyl-[acyl-carrier-protein] synthase-1
VSELAVWSLGASSPLGIDARQTTLFWRAGKANPRGTPFRDKTGVSVGAIRQERLPDDLVGYERMLALAIPALEEALASAPAHTVGERKTVLLLSLPEPYEGEDERIGARLLVELAAAHRLDLDDRSAAVRVGRAGVTALLGRAQMFGGDVRVIVGGVDSYYDGARIATLDNGYRLLSERSGNGFIPSEAAAFACVAPRTKRAAGEVPLATVRFVATGEEDLDGPPVAACLTKLLADPRIPSPVPWMLTDMNGERHRLKELTYATMRNRVRVDQDATVTQHVPSELGDVGAASGAVFLVLATLGMRLGFSKADSALVVTCSEGRPRGVFLVGVER